ncbi:MAG: hypothetical protein PHQ28_16720 [Mycobacterium sp.]|nr:hypothetical protein [Mycobacterium sp.]
MATNRHRAAARSRSEDGDKPARQHRRELVAAASGATLIGVVGLLSGWAHHDLSTAPPTAPSIAATASSTGATTSPHLRVQLRAWLTQAQPSIDALMAARHEVAAAAAGDDIIATGAACRKADTAVAGAQQYLPSPDLELNTALAHAIGSYRVGVRFCIAGVERRDANDISRAAGYISAGNAELQHAVDILQRDLPDARPSDPGVRTV